MKMATFQIRSFLTRLNAKIYLKECLIKRLLPFIEKHHSFKDILFWPDLATSHYTKDVQNWLKSQNIDFVSKTENAPNVPKARPIEKFWANCKQEYKKRSKPAENLTQFKSIWRRLSKKVA